MGWTTTGSTLHRFIVKLIKQQKCKYKPDSLVFHHIFISKSVIWEILFNAEMIIQRIERLITQVIPLLVDSWATKQESKKIFEATVAASGELSGLTLDQCPLKHSPSHFMFDF